MLPQLLQWLLLWLLQAVIRRPKEDRGNVAAGDLGEGWQFYLVTLLQPLGGLLWLLLLWQRLWLLLLRRLWLRRGRGPLLPGGSGGRGIRRRICGGGSNPSSSNRRRCHRGAISGTGGVGVVALGWGTWRLQSHRGKELIDVREVVMQQGIDVRVTHGAERAARAC